VSGDGVERATDPLDHIDLESRSVLGDPPLLPRAAERHEEELRARVVDPVDERPSRWNTELSKWTGPVIRSRTKTHRSGEGSARRGRTAPAALLSGIT
jgi:hypothetical protein